MPLWAFAIAVACVAPIAVRMIVQSENDKKQKRTEEALKRILASEKLPPPP